ncbi:MAG TPA: O-antigen ligase family protein [Terriglobales bacterium]|nr:O-antigen ligase family protein [Terriglobales bacterium]
MFITGLLWVLVWGGMYSDVSRFNAEALLAGPASFVLTMRPFLPILAMAVCLVLLVRKRTIALALEPGPFLSLSLYGLLGAAFFFLSPEPFFSLYWGGLFLAAPFVVWTLVNTGDAEARLGLVMSINAAVILVMVLFYIAGPLWPILRGAHNPRLYKLPFGLGLQTANGVGRFAGVLGLIALSRLRGPGLAKRALWAGLLAASVLGLALSESRTAILGFIVGSLLIVVSGRRLTWLAALVPGVFYFLYKAWFVWRFNGSLENAFFLTGRETTWRKALAIALRSPLAGHGFHADRLMLEGEHVHMAYLHSLIQGGLLGALFFTAAIVGLWVLVVRRRVVQRAALAEGPAAFLVTESLAVLGFLTARSFFESTAAFYGVDLLLFVPAMAYLQVWSRDHPPASALADASAVRP